MGVSILGLASAVPTLEAPASRFNEFARKWAKPSKALEKTLFINGHTKIEQRASVHDETSSLLNRPDPPPIEDVCAAFLDLGVSLALVACEKAIHDWGRPIEDITHLICTTCTGSSHPGYDLYLHQRLGLDPGVERTLLHGVGCAGGLSIVRLAKQICVAAEHSGQKVRVLVVALEIASSMLRTELQSIDEEGERGGTAPNIASVIFSDAASAMVVGSDLNENEHASFEIEQCITHTVLGTPDDLGFNIRQNGWRAVLTRNVPEIVGTAVPSVFQRLMKESGTPHTSANEFDWFIHTGGSLIIEAVSEILNLSDRDPTQTTASWERYKARGNSSSASIGGVIERGQEIGGREQAIAVSFGPGVTVEMCLLRRCPQRAATTPNGVHQSNGHMDR